MPAAAPEQRGCSSGIRSNGVVAVVGAHVAAAVVRSALVDIQALLAIPRCGVPPRTTVARVVPARQVLALARWRAKRFRAPVLLARRILHASRPLPHLMARGSRRRRSSTSGGSSMGRAGAVPCRRKARSHKGMRHPCIQTNLPAQTKTAMPRSSVPGGSEYRPRAHFLFQLLTARFYPTCAHHSADCATHQSSPDLTQTAAASVMMEEPVRPQEWAAHRGC
jgi:hypothetical protein